MTATARVRPGRTERLLRAALGLTVATALAACATRPVAVPQTAAFEGDGGNAVYVLGHGWHTGLVVPSSRIRPLIPVLGVDLGEAPFLEFGWGDAGFYRAGEMSSGLALRAIFTATDSVVHVAAVPSTAYAFVTTKTVARLCLTDAQLSTLLRFIADSFRRDERKRVMPAENGAPGRSRFYHGVGHYYLLNTCNTWTAKALSSAGMDISPASRLTADSVTGYLRRHARVVMVDPRDWPDVLAGPRGDCRVGD